MTRLNLNSLRKTTTALRAETYYSLLRVSPGSTPEVIHKAYLALAVQFHPDKESGDAERFKPVALAYGVLKNAEMRKRYDAKLRLEQRACKECNGRGLLKRQASFTTVKEVVCKPCAGAGFL